MLNHRAPQCDLNGGKSVFLWRKTRITAERDPNGRMATGGSWYSPQRGCSVFGWVAVSGGVVAGFSAGRVSWFGAAAPGSIR